VRQGRIRLLARHYPPNPLPEPEQFWAALVETLGERSSEILPWLDRAPQTNEVGRSAVLFAGLSYLASIHDRPMQLFEVGASAGLNLNLDRYGYRYAGEQFGDADSPLQLSPAWQGPLPPRSDVRILSRCGCDLSPLDATKHQDRERLLAYVWPDQIDRVERLTRALEIAVLHPVKIMKADAAEWIERTTPQDGLRVLMHSIAFQYFPLESQERITRHMEATGARSDSPLAWLRFELDPESQKRFSLRLRLWPDGADQLLAIAGPHGTPIEWLSIPSR
jgi:hypothetical protein